MSGIKRQLIAVNNQIGWGQEQPERSVGALDVARRHGDANKVETLLPFLCLMVFGAAMGLVVRSYEGCKIS